MAHFDNLSHSIVSHIKTELASIIKHIAKDYDLDEHELRNRYLGHIGKNAKNKRQRKKKNADDFIEAEELIVSGKMYYVDANNNVYTNDINNPVLIGKRTGPGGNVTFVSEYLQ
jgi:hypothetical protein